MKKIYVIGNNTSKSLSPVIFNYWFRRYKIKAKYEYIELNNSNFDKKIKEIKKDKDTIGINITIPFKQKIIKHTDLLDRHAKQINAVNCLSFGTKTKGINTDWTGYFKTLPKKNNIKKMKVLLVGYGGAALAIHYVLKHKGFKNINIINRTKKKLMFEKKTKYTISFNKLHEFLSNADLIINTTPINPINSFEKKFVKKETILSDLVYKPKETKFLKLFPNNKKIYGISMLLEQAAPCFKLWFGFSPAVDKKLIKILENKIK